MAYTTIDDPTIYFNTKLYTGNATDDTTISGVGFQSDWTWIKSRSDASWHQVTDSVRGAGNVISTNSNGAESNFSSLKSFNSDGFVLSDNSNFNGNGVTFASWNWKMGTAFSNDASATGVGTIDSTGSVSTTAGQSIISYSGTGSAGTIAHGLGAVPKMIMIKETSGNASGGNQSWSVYHQALGNTHFIPLNSTEAKIDDVDFNDTTPTSSVFSVGVQNRTNSGNGNGVYIAYVFAEKKGYSKFGSYTGNGNADGTFVYTGMKSSFIMLKPTSTTGNWFILDNKRSSFNVMDKYIRANQSSAEATFSMMDFVSNGVKIKTSDSSINGSGVSYIYMAFAENPFVTSTGIPTTAR